MRNIGEKLSTYLLYRKRNYAGGNSCTNSFLPVLGWPQWWSFAAVRQQGLDFTKKSVVGPGRQKVPKSDFKVNFLCQKSFESFWMFFFHYWISVLKKDFCYFLQNSIFKPLCFLKWFPVFDGLCEHLWKSNQKLFFLLIFC